MTDEAPAGPVRTWQRRLTPPLVSCAFQATFALILGVKGGLSWPAGPLALALAVLAAAAAFLGGLGIQSRTPYAHLLTALATAGLGAYLLWLVAEGKRQQDDLAGSLLLLGWAWLAVPGMFLAGFGGAHAGSATRRFFFR